MSNKIIISAVFSLLIGGFVGYNLSSLNNKDERVGYHKMSDGTMMKGAMNMEHMMGSMNETLIGKTGDAFDQEFLSQMIVHHEGAVEMAELALNNSGKEEIKSLAEQIIEAQNTEISQMKEWQNKWFK